MIKNDAKMGLSISGIQPADSADEKKVRGEKLRPDLGGIEIMSISFSKLILSFVGEKLRPDLGGIEIVSSNHPLYSPFNTGEKLRPDLGGIEMFGVLSIYFPTQ